MDSLEEGAECPGGRLARAPRASGHRRAQDARALPQPFFVCFKEAGLWRIVGAMVLSRVQQVRGAEHVCWDILRFVHLAERVDALPTDMRYCSAVCKARGEVELRLRRSAASEGGIINDHFSEFSTANWRVFCVEQAAWPQFDQSSADRPRQVYSPASVARLVGVVPQGVDAISPHPETLADRIVDSDADPLQEALGPPQAGRDAPGRTSVTDLVGTLLERMRRNTSSHAVTGHTYSVESILGFLKFANKLRPTAGLDRALVDAAEVFFGKPRQTKCVPAWRTCTARASTSCAFLGCVSIL